MLFWMAVLNVFNDDLVPMARDSHLDAYYLNLAVMS